MRTIAVEDWLGGLIGIKTLRPLAPATKAKIRNVMHALFNHPMRHEWLEKNPITLVRQSAKRQRIPDVLEVGEIKALLAELQEPVKTMVLLAAATGLRVSELIGLKWGDIDFEKLEINLSRGVVDGVVGTMKTEASRKPIPLDPGLTEVILDWQARSEFRGHDDWLFASPRMKGNKPYSPDTLVLKVIRPAAQRAGIGKRIGWHTFIRYAPKSEWRRCQSRSGVSASRKQSHHAGYVHASGYSCETTGTGEGSQDDSADDRGFSHGGGNEPQINERVLKTGEKRIATCYKFRTPQQAVCEKVLLGIGFSQPLRHPIQWENNPKQ